MGSLSVFLTDISEAFISFVTQAIGVSQKNFQSSGAEENCFRQNKIILRHDSDCIEEAARTTQSEEKGKSTRSQKTDKKTYAEGVTRKSKRLKESSVHKAYTVSTEVQDLHSSTSSNQSNINPLPVYCCKVCSLASGSLDRFKVHTCRGSVTGSCTIPAVRLGSAEREILELSTPNLITNSLKLHKLRKFVCELCCVEFRTLHRIAYHLPRCSPGPYSCIICSDLFASKRELNVHKKKTHQDTKCFTCDECAKSFLRRTSLQKHVINAHENLVHSTGPFKCDSCTKKFVRRIYLTHHKVRMHGLEKKFLCQVCGKRFLNHNTLTTHLASHSNIRPFVCHFCHKSFRRKEKLVYHERVHTGERPFSCEQCARSFVCKSKCDEHSRRHRSDVRFRCTECIKSYSTAYDLKKHFRNFHETLGAKMDEKIVDISTQGKTGHPICQDSVILVNCSSQEKQNGVPLSESNLTTEGLPSNLPGSIGVGLQYINVGAQQSISIPIVAGNFANLHSLGHMMQVASSHISGGTNMSALNPSMAVNSSSLHSLSSLSAVNASEFTSLPTHHALQTQGFILAQGFDVINTTLQF